MTSTFSILRHDRNRPHDTDHQVHDAPVRARLDDHIREWLGVWPPQIRYQIVVTPERDLPGWDGLVRPIQGIHSPEGSIAAVSPRYASLFADVDLEALILDLKAPDARVRVSTRLGIPVSFGMPIFRWAERAAEQPEIGEWVSAEDPRLPDWVRPFGGDVLAAFDERDNYVAGVGLKVHNHLAQEISVGTDRNHRGRGYARMLVAQAARSIIADGGIPIYQHDERNISSARVADAAGFPDRGWRSIEIHPGIPDQP